MPFLSIVIPVYNVEKYLEQCINSILDQNYNNYEIILVNDASTDMSGEICDFYASKYRNIKAIHLKDKLLPGGARNVGLKNAVGEYVHFCDSDDYYMPNVFQCIEDKLKETYPELLIGQFVSKPEKGAYVCNNVQISKDKIAGCDSLSLIEHILDTPNFLCTVWRFIAKRKFLISNNIRFPERCYSEDEEWVPKVLCNVKTFSIFESPFYCYRPRVVGSVTASKGFINSKSSLLVAFNLLRFLQEKNYKDIRRKLICSRVNMLMGIFSTRCDTFTTQEIYDLANIVDANIDILPLFNELNDERKFYYYINAFGFREGLVFYCDYVIKQTLELVKDNAENKDIYIFPTGNNGESSARILRKAGYKVKGFLDNSEYKNNCYIDGIPVSLPSTLKNMSQSELNNLFIIVSVQQKEIANIIMNQLRGYGIEDSQFVSRIY